MSFGAIKMMNDKEFRQKCREISYASIEEYRNLLPEIAIRSVEDRMWKNDDN